MSVWFSCGPSHARPAAPLGVGNPSDNFAEMRECISWAAKGVKDIHLLHTVSAARDLVGKRELSTDCLHSLFLLQDRTGYIFFGVTVIATFDV